jgi:steroid delta-isomerase-like uncharacterized protein
MRTLKMARVIYDNRPPSNARQDTEHRWNDRKEGPIMSDVIPGVTTQVLQAFAEAWNRHDVDALMSFMTEDCVFEASAGSDVCGTRYVGRESVRAGFAEVWATYPDAQWTDARHFVHEERGVSEWTFTGTRADGTRVEVRGCDLFTFRDGRICLKNSYRKNRPPLGTPKR